MFKTFSEVKIKIDDLYYEIIQQIMKNYEKK